MIESKIREVEMTGKFCTRFNLIYINNECIVGYEKLLQKITDIKEICIKYNKIGDYESEVRDFNY